MRTLLIVALVAACGGGGKKKPEPLTGSAKTPTAAPAKPAADFKVEFVATTSPVSIEITVRERVKKEPLVGATLVVTSPVLQGSQAAITDEQGRTTYPRLPPGDYELTA